MFNIPDIQMFNCHRQTTERQFCNAKQSECGADAEAFSSKCLLSGWTDWTECSVKWYIYNYFMLSAWVPPEKVWWFQIPEFKLNIINSSSGRGTRRRERKLLDGTDKNCNVELMATEECIGFCCCKFSHKNNIIVGDDGEDCSVQPNPLCQTTSWSELFSSSLSSNLFNNK